MHLFSNIVFNNAVGLMVKRNVIFFLLLGGHSFGQNALSEGISIGDSESFFHLQDDTIKREIAFFNKSANLDKSGSALEKIPVNEISLKKCNENLAYFDISNWISTSLIVSISADDFDSTKHKLTFDATPQHNLQSIDGHAVFGTNGKVPKKEIVNIRSLHGPHAQARIPVSAFEGIYDPNLCSHYLDEYKKEKVVSNCKLFRSLDRRRRYIYLIIGTEEYRYEVVWVIKDLKYFTRVIDKIR